MFGLFKPRCPIDVREKVWAEQRLLWLCERFGLKRMLNATIVEPTVEFFPDSYSAVPEDIDPLFERVCKFADCSPDRFQRVVIGDDEHFATNTDPSVVAIRKSDLLDQEDLIASLARGIARSLLLTDKHLTGEEADFWLVTDLLAVFLGFGVIQANSAVKTYAESSGTSSSWSIRHAGFLQARVSGYAMALVAWLRSEDKNSWSGQMGSDGRSAFTNGLKYLNKTGDSVLQSENAGRSVTTRSHSAMVDDLTSGSDSFKLSALWELISYPKSYERIEKPLLDLLLERDTILSSAAAIVAAAFGPDAKSTVPVLIERVHSDSVEVRICSVIALGKIKPPIATEEDHRPIEMMFETLLKDSNAVVVEATIDTLAAYGQDALPLAPKVVPFLLKLVKSCDYGRLNRVLPKLESIVGDNKQFLTDQTVETDPEIRQWLLSELDPENDVDSEAGDPSDPESATVASPATDSNQSFSDWIRMPVNLSNMSGLSGFRLSAPDTIGADLI